MLEIRNLIKKYKAKGGVVVTALNSVSLKFPETGMIFLLGKSGSGKSTLLNVVGGLDRPDSGEIIIKGKNSKSFSAADFDSYRNTYIGFIFQEYNILNEFNVEQNISLALQLQGKPNDKKTVEALLEQVDLKGYGKRKPNTLSGGQKQRVAIARALIKSPEIIMADEPTGALDSNTGKQVFDTLKKLSQEKLVIVVSHDRDFAETYGDRIIELSDGQVISDVTKEFVEPVLIGENIQVVNDHTLSIKDASKLKKDDMDAIYEILKKQNGQAIISSGEHDVGVVKQAIHMTDNSGSAVFNDTDEVEVKEYDPKQTKFIRSHLPIARAFKMGSSSLKSKPVRLIFTSFLTTVSLTMFGLTSTLMLFDENYSVSKAMQTSERVSEMVQKEYYYKTVDSRINIATGEVESTNTYPNGSSRIMLTKEDLDSLNHNNEGMKFAGVYSFGNEWEQPSFYNVNFSEASSLYYQITNPQGFVEVNQQMLNDHKLSLLAGALPANKNEVVISNYFFNLFKDSDELISNYQDLIGKDITISVSTEGRNSKINFSISGIINAGDLPAKYDDLKDNSNDKLSVEQINDLVGQFKDFLNFSYYTFIYVHNDFYNEIYYPIMGDKDPFVYASNAMPSVYASGFALQAGQPFMDKDNIEFYSTNFYPYEIIKDKYTSNVEFCDVNGNKKALTAMAETDIYLSENQFTQIKAQATAEYLQKFSMLLGADNYNPTLYSFLHAGDNYATYEALRDRLQNYYYAKDYKEGYSREEDVAKATQFIKQYYLDTQKAYYTLAIASRYRELFNQRELVSYSEYETFTQDIDNAYSTTPLNLTNLNRIKQFLVNDHDGLAKLAMILYEIDTIWGVDCVDEFREQYYAGVEISDSLTNQVIDYLKDVRPGFTGTFTDDIFTDALEMPKIYYASSNGKNGLMNLIGYYVTEGYNDATIMSINFISKNVSVPDYCWSSEMQTDYVKNGTPRYFGAITRSDYSQSEIAVLRQKTSTYGYYFSNTTYDNIIMILSLISLLQAVFLVLGIVFGVFAALMLLNFISTSIASKTKDIGVLRAVGARGSDLFKIFFSESGVVTFICLLLAVIGSALSCYFLNAYMVREVGIMMLNFSIVNIGIMVAGALLIAFIGTFLPVLRAAMRPPVESIRTL